MKSQKIRVTTNIFSGRESPVIKFSELKISQLYIHFKERLKDALNLV